jgi:hypothetical protein
MLFSSPSAASQKKTGLSNSGSSTRLLQLNRSLPSTPVLKSNSPQFCLVVLDMEMKDRLWLVLDDGTVHVLRDGQWQQRPFDAPPGSRWRECLIGDVNESATGLTHRELKLLFANDLLTVTAASDGHGLKNPGYIATNLKCASRPESAPIVHLGGPLTFLAALSEDEGPAYLLVEIGTEGLGEGAFSAITYSAAVQLTSRPIAEIAFQGTDGKARRERVVLTYDSCVDGFHGCMRVAEGDGTGEARLTIEWPDWPEANLAPWIVDVPVKRLEWPMHMEPFLAAGCGTMAATRGPRSQVVERESAAARLLQS